MGVSLMERLVGWRSAWERVPPAYEVPELAKVHALSVNYRSHPAILSLFSGLFYGDLPAPGLLSGLLSPFASSPNAAARVGSNDLDDLAPTVAALQQPPLGLPLTAAQPACFKHVAGVCSRSAPAPGQRCRGVSRFNEEEADEVLAIAAALVASGVDPTDVAVITPYRAQVDVLRSRIAALPPGIEVDTVEKFQGRERRVVLFSVVRSNSAQQEQQQQQQQQQQQTRDPSSSDGPTPAADVPSEIGFLDNWRRLNVAISRAKSLMVVVGNAEALSAASVTWANLVGAFIERGAYTGPVTADMARIEDL